MTDLVDVDVTNPGQVLACLGLLEIMERLAPDTVGGFEEERRFRFEGQASVRDALEAIRGSTVGYESVPTRAKSSIDEKARPVELKGEWGSLTLDPWLSPDHRDVATGFKLWAGQVTTRDLLEGLRRRLPQPAHGAERSLLSLGTRGTPTGLDPRSAVSKSDVGYSYNDQGLKPMIYPAVDLFGFIGAHGAKPRRTGGSTYSYALWEKPLPAQVARAVMGGRLPERASLRLEYTVESRGLAGTYKYLSFGRPIEGRT